MLKRQCIRYKEFLFVAVGLFCFYGIGIGNIYGFSIFPDEFAYWAYAAAIGGYDWSEITSLGSYYSYGYSLVLFPVFMLCKNAVTAYRVAIGLNFLLLFLAFLFLTQTMRKMAGDKEIPIILFSALVILFPGNLFYAQMTMTEALLVSLYVLAGSILLYYLEKDSLPALCLLMLVWMYLYIVHMRTIGILISGILVLLFHILAGNGKKSHIPVIAGMTALLFLAGNVMKEQILSGMYDGIRRGLAAGNDYSGQVEKIRYIFTRAGFYDFVINIFGKILYLGLATYGLFYWGIYALTKRIAEMFRNLKKRMTPDAKQQFALFIGLSVAAQILIATIYLLTLGEIDDYTYGRYSELIIPFVMVSGLTALWKMRPKQILLGTGALAAVQLVITVLTVRQIINTGTDVFYGYFMVGISYLYRDGLYDSGAVINNLSCGAGFDVCRFYLGAYLMGELLTAVMTVIILWERKKQKKRYTVIAFMVLEILLAVQMEKVYLEPFQKAAFRDSRLADKIVELQQEEWQEWRQEELLDRTSEINNRNVIYMDGNLRPYVGILQFMARDTEIQVRERRASVSDYNEDITGEDILIFAFDDIFWQEWTGRYAHADVYGHFAVLYN